MDQEKSRAKATCPVCGSPTEPQIRPFCSQRCADVDLGRWMTGRYAIPTDEPPAGGGDGSDRDG